MLPVFVGVTLPYALPNGRIDGARGDFVSLSHACKQCTEVMLSSVPILLQGFEGQGRRTQDN